MPAHLTQKFSQNLESIGFFEPAPTMAVGVSGGADSLALCLLLHARALNRGGKVVALTVDHQLRPESGKEALKVAKWLAKRNIEHHILKSDQKPATHTKNIQHNARALRYHLMEEWCAQHHVLHLAIAHHQADQGETFLLRLKRGSGVFGLSAMGGVRILNKVRLIRPLLNIPKEALKTYLKNQKQRWIEDPSNHNPSFDRIKIRQQQNTFTQLGLTHPLLAQTATTLGQDRAMAEKNISAFMARHAVISPYGFITLRQPAMLEISEEMALKVLGNCLRAMGGQDYPPRYEDLRALYKRLMFTNRRGHTLGGCYLFKARYKILILREEGLIKPTSPTPPVTWWDNRFLIHSDQAGATTLQPLGEEGWHQLCADAPTKPPTLGLPKKVIFTLPALFNLDDLLSVPHLNYNKDKALKSVRITLKLKHPLMGPYFQPLKA